ncbi:hypothetical protein AYI69_g7597 [Smittium culicis]|uniref:Uncharacterized protein n=1 Tax=Smittium culicis TaxID=133412 RepID=A0A1R1XQW1_9FUNG|nr:hypothetical protein AYI69_g9590 [Smittium culicis]OMJ17030.1 hypothetical protein AYI69_g7597 [Smittium culicis]
MIIAAVNRLSMVNVEKFEKSFLIGFCFGAKEVMVLYAQDTFYLGGALCRPSVLEISNIDKVQAPMNVPVSKEEYRLHQILRIFEL